MEWDDVVDVVCVGSGAGGLAAAIVAVDAGQTVFVTESPIAVGVNSSYGTAVADRATNEYFDAITENLSPPTSMEFDSALPIRVADDATAVASCRRGRTAVEPFVGARLRDWDSACLGAPSGVVYSHVTDRNMTSMRSADGEQFEVAVVGRLGPGIECGASAVTDWLIGQALARDIDVHSGSPVERLVFGDGRVLGAVIATPAGARAVRGQLGVITSIGPGEVGAAARLNAVGHGAARVGIVSKTASRFGRVALLAKGPRPQPHIASPSSVSRQLRSRRHTHMSGAARPPIAEHGGRGDGAP